MHIPSSLNHQSIYLKMKKSLGAFALFGSIALSANAVTVDTSNPISRVVRCNSTDTLGQCVAAVDSGLQNVLSSGRAKWKGGYLVMQPGNKIRAYQNGVSLGDFDTAVTSALSIANSQFSSANSTISDGEIGFIAGGLFITISTRIMAFGTPKQSVFVCINGDCEMTYY